MKKAMPKKSVRQDFEALAVILSVAMVVAIVSLASNLMTAMPVTSAISTGPHFSDKERRVDERFQQAIGLLHAKQYDYAITALDSVLDMAPGMPEAYVNMGYAFIGLEEFGPARGAFEKAIDLKVDQVNAYYGLAIAFEGQE
jgi:Tfp pilus assembly protein PilF